MKSITGLISLMVTAAISIGAYLFFLKQAAPEPGMVVTQEISLTGVQSDLVSIAQAERNYFAQNGVYADLPTLASNGTMNITRTSRDGYTYSADPAGSDFRVTARYTAPPVPMPNGAAPPHFPTFTIDQTMEVHRLD